MSDYSFSLKTVYSSGQDGCDCKVTASDSQGFNVTIDESGKSPYTVLNKAVDRLVDEYAAATRKSKKIEQTTEEKLAVMTKKYEDALARIDRLEKQLKPCADVKGQVMIRPKKDDKIKLNEGTKKKDFSSRYIEELNKLLKSL